jgi:hypothetical protein
MLDASDTGVATWWGGRWQWKAWGLRVAGAEMDTEVVLRRDVTSAA